MSGVKKPLAENAERGVALIQNLTGPGGQMPKEIIASSQAIAVVSQIKVGLGIGVSYGSGFVVKRLGPKEWSAPLFIAIKNISAGFTIGGGEVATVICMKDQAAMEAFLFGGLVLGTDAMLQKTPHPFDVHLETGAMHANSADTIWGYVESGGVASYNIANGLGIDLSLKGGILVVDEATNHELFGEGVTSDALLGGGIPAPPEFAPFYDSLNQLGQA